MVYLILSIACSLAIAAIFKYNEMRARDRVVLLTVNYWVAAILAGVVVWQTGGAPVNWLRTSCDFWFLALITGGLFISTYFILAWATNVAGMGLATGIMRVSVVVPVVVSWILWQERPSPAQMIGLVLASVAFFGIATRRNVHGGGFSSAHPLAVFAVLTLLFLSGGIVDTCMKLFDELFAHRYRETYFLTIVYLVAAIIGIGITGWKYSGESGGPNTEVIRWGMLLGVCNYGATLFFLRAVARLEAPFVFPANSISIVLGAALIGVYVWRERLSRINRIGLGLAAAALLLLHV